MSPMESSATRKTLQDVLPVTAAVIIRFLLVESRVAFPVVTSASVLPGVQP